MSAAQINAAVMRAVYRQPSGFRAWCLNQVSIKDKETGRIVGPGEWELNILQERVCAVVEFCLTNNLPIRIIGVKPRQKGSSLIFTLLDKWFCEVYANTTGFIIGAKDENVQSLWDYVTLTVSTDQMNWGPHARVLGRQIVFGNGSQIRRDSVEGKHPGVGWDCRLMHLTECALWAEQGVKNARDMHARAMGGIEYLPGTCIIEESTSRGPAGLFFEHWTDAVTLEEFQADPFRCHGKFIRVEAGWQEFGRLCRMDLTEPQAYALESELEPWERAQRDRLKLDLEQCFWYRTILHQKYNGDRNMMAQEHPESSVQAFTASAPSVFDQDGLAVLEAHVELNRQKWQLGILHEVKGRVTFQATGPGAAMWHFLEQPMPGGEYLIGVDFMSGRALDAAAKRRDHHRITVYRKGRFENGVWKKGSIVAHTIWPCQWGLNVLEEEIWRISILFGRCLIVPERNFDGGVTRNLVNRGANVFFPRMEVDVSLVKRESRPAEYYGLQTSGGGKEADASKRAIVNALMVAILGYDKPGRGLVVDERTLHELRVFVQDKDGFYGALAGEHDDTVMALGFCVLLQNDATLYWPSPEESPEIYGDPMALERFRGRSGETVSLGLGL